MKSERLVGLDLYKMVAMLGVVMLHVLGRGGGYRLCVLNTLIA